MNSTVISTTRVRKETESVNIKSASDLTGKIWCNFPIANKCYKITLIKKSVLGNALRCVNRSDK